MQSPEPFLVQLVIPFHAEMLLRLVIVRDRGLEIGIQIAEIRLQLALLLSGAAHRAAEFLQMPDQQIGIE